MTIQRRTFSKIAAAGALAVAAPSILKAQTGPLRLGVLTPRSGAAATLGEDSLRGMQWGADRINAAGGIAGRQVQLIVQEETSPKDTIERFRQLVLKDRVDSVHGLISTGVTLALAPIAEEERVLTMCWHGTTQNGVQEVMPKTNFVFRSTDNECEAVMSALLTVKLLKGQFRTIAGVNPDYSYGRNNWEAFKVILARYGIEARVVSEQWIKPGATDLTANVAALSAAKPDLIFSSMFLADVPIFLRQGKAAGLFDKSRLVLPAAGVQTNVLRKEFVPEGTVFGHDTLYFAHPGASALQKAFIAEYRDRYKAIPSSCADRAYFNLMAYKAGVEAAHKAVGRWPKPDEIAAAIPGLAVESIGGKGMYRADKVANQMFYQGLTTNQNDMDVPTLSKVESVFSDQLQKPNGADFWEWIKSTSFPI